VVGDNHGMYNPGRVDRLRAGSFLKLHLLLPLFR
jgi:hypothetical protein